MRPPPHIPQRVEFRDTPLQGPGVEIAADAVFHHSAFPPQGFRGVQLHPREAVLELQDRLDVRLVEARTEPVAVGDLLPATHILLHLVQGLSELADILEAPHAAVLVALLEPILLPADRLAEPPLELLDLVHDLRRCHEPVERPAAPEAFRRQPRWRIARVVPDFLERGRLAKQAAVGALQQQRGRHEVALLQKSSHVVFVDHVEHRTAPPPPASDRARRDMIQPSQARRLSLPALPAEFQEKRCNNSCRSDGWSRHQAQGTEHR